MDQFSDAVDTRSPDVTVMAPAASGVRRMGACETTPQTSTQPGTVSPQQPATRDLACSSLLIVGRRLPASSSFVLTAP